MMPSLKSNSPAFIRETIRFTGWGVFFLFGIGIPYLLHQQLFGRSVLTPSPVEKHCMTENSSAITDTFLSKKTPSKQQKDFETIENFAKTVLGYKEMPPDQCKAKPGFFHGKLLYQYDLMKEGPYPFLSNYRSPCWQDPQTNTLSCLPYFYLIGFPKCGTTDMYQRILGHPDVVSWTKEPHWLTRTRFKGVSMNVYIQRYATALTQKSNDSRLSIAGDGSASTAWDHENWKVLPGNENCTEPRIINADYIRHLNPNAKIIVMLRNPSTRLYSEFLYFKKMSQEKFHQFVESNIAVFKACVATESLRSCAYNRSLYTIRLYVGLYAIFLEDWLLRFPRKQILPIRLEDGLRSTKVMHTVFTFLNLTVPTDATMQEIEVLEKANVGKRFQTIGPMWNKTRLLLDNFYRPFNRRLAVILQDRRFTWEDE